MTSPLEILFADERLLVVHKPSGLLVHRGWANDPITLVDLIAAHTGAAAHPIGRLDRGASGVMLFARDPAQASALSAARERGDLRRHYLALVRGTAPAEGRIDHPLARKAGGPRVPSTSLFARHQSIATLPRESSLVEVVPLSGRLHQVRRHLKHLNHPLLGDANYGKAELNRGFAEQYGLARLALHAWRLLLPGPGETRIEVVADLPDDFAGPLRRMGFTLDGLQCSPALDRSARASQ